MVAKFLICICASLHVIIKLLNCMSASHLMGAENETWRCLEDVGDILINMTMKDNPKPRVYLYKEVTVQERGH